MILVRAAVDRHGDTWIIRSGHATHVHYAAEPGKWLPTVRPQHWTAATVEASFGPLTDLTAGELPVQLPAGYTLATTVLGTVP